MTILSNKAKTIQFSLSDKVNIIKEPDVPASYSLEMPTIICNNADDAINLQKEINTYISNLINNKIKEKE